jgi:hypothetical protein
LVRNSIKKKWHVTHIERFIYSPLQLAIRSAYWIACRKKRYVRNGKPKLANYTQSKGFGGWAGEMKNVNTDKASDDKCGS